MKGAGTAARRSGFCLASVCTIVSACALQGSARFPECRSVAGPTADRVFRCTKHMLQIRAERALGHTLGEEVRNLRITAAHDLVAETDRPIAEIADRCGFTSVSHLALRFKEAYGTKPLALRKAFMEAPLTGKHRK